MIWNDHSRDIPDGAHAVLGASQYHWLNYDDDKLVVSYRNAKAQERGTELHALAAELIKKKIEVKGKDTFAMYVNDSIKFRMRPEQKLKYSDMCFGTADAIVFNERKRLLRINDLKTGVTPASMKQLHIYAALFCLEYRFDPTDIDMELRIYQNNEITIDHPELDVMHFTMDRIVHCSSILEEVKAEEYDDE